ncbi:MAG: 3-hydroxyacyl-ACP dehydratase FabZ [Thiocapsa sp.]|uniref:3-hydroxyacyl-ACP dehydratase FabZ n=1 Tax=Thiocapsa sp. TaxID=2024551 RepID=UPI001BCE10D1|nr:3-hydroxyacyl-ACP dehydratase FabZ [Thiocapsa sp.]QVL47834.1 MAG: 3-hydroxyacyl-ACP dehydratase FabZ [Thiocapsa sp.]
MPIQKPAITNACPNSVRIAEILSTLPHRFPFLLVDRVVDYQAGRALEARKLVTANEHYMASESQFFPSVLIVEAMAQATGILAVLSAEEVSADSRFFLIGVDRTSFSGHVEAGDQLAIQVRVLRITQGVGKFQAEASVGGVQVAIAELMCAAQI